MDDRFLYDFVNISNRSRSSRFRDRHATRRSKRLTANNLSTFGKESVSNEVPKFEPKKPSLFNHILKREIYGLNVKSIEDIVSRHLSTAMPTILREKELDLGDVNKVFAAKWVNNNRVVLGTKCNKILIKDVCTNDMIQIPTIKSSGKTAAALCPCGIHAISLNPSRTLLATGAEHTNDLAVYRLPSFDPVFLGEHGHTDWIFDLDWVDDEFCITGSRDSKLAIWKIVDKEHQRLDEVQEYMTSSGPVPTFDYSIGKPELVKGVDSADKIRALAYNANGLEMGVLSLNSRIHTWDISTFEMKASRKLTYSRETVCMAYDSAKQVYAVGSQSNVTLLDRDLSPVLNIEAKHKGCGIRSLSFNENIITIGTGLGHVLFYDMNAGKYLPCSCGQACILNVGQGYLLRDDTWRDYFSEHDYHNAIYTHCYDDSGTRLFTAGGPLPAGLVGNYAGIWH